MDLMQDDADVGNEGDDADNADAHGDGGHAEDGGW